MSRDGHVGEAVRVSGLVKRFGPRAVLDSVDLEVPRGQVIGLLGLNGSGKSTLIKCLLGLLKADEGSATVLGTAAWQLADREKARIGYVPQEATLYPWLTVRQTVAYVSSFYSRWDRPWEASSCAAGISPSATASAHSRSGKSKSSPSCSPSAIAPSF